MFERRQRDDPSRRLPRNPATMGDEDECLDLGALQAYHLGKMITDRGPLFLKKKVIFLM